MSYGVDACAHLVVGFDDVPGSEFGVGVVEHHFFSFGVFVPPVSRSKVDRAELPLFQRVFLPPLEASFLFGAAHREVEFDDPDACAGPHLLNERRDPQEFLVLLISAEAHHSFYACSVVPGAVEESDFTSRWEMSDVALEVPLAGFFFSWFFERDHLGATWVEMLHESPDSAAFSCGVSALEDD